MARDKRPIRVGQVWEMTDFGERTWPLTVVGLIDMEGLSSHEWLYVLLGRDFEGKPYLIALADVDVRKDARCVRDLTGIA